MEDFSDAILTNNIDQLKFLLLNGADPNVSKSGWTPLILAISYNRPRMVSLLLKNGAKVNDSDLLHEAISVNRIEIIKMLLEYGADVNRQKHKFDGGRTPLHQAVIEGKTDIVELLLEYGADTSIEDSFGYTPLYYSKSEEIIKLLEHASNDIKEPDYGSDY